MINQGNRCIRRFTRRFSISAGLAVAAILSITACSTAVHVPAPENLSGTQPLDLLTLFLEKEQSQGAAKFTFSGKIDVKAGDLHSFRGVGAYKPCSSLRIKLLGPLGFTLLEYINSEGRARLLSNQLTPEGDEEARVGLLQMMQIFTLALGDRCHSLEEFDEESHDANLVKFTLPTQTNGVRHLSLDRKKAALLQQSISGGQHPGTVIDYTDYRWSDGYWMPYGIDIQGTDMPVSISMEIRKWSVNVALPDHLFVVD